MKKIIVVGASAASISFIAKVRTFDKESEIICFSGEAYLPYNRCFLADVLEKEKTIEDIQLKPESFYKEKNIDLRIDHWVESVDYETQKVIVKGELYDYDYLFLGVGSHALHPPFYDETVGGLFSFHTLGDIEKINSFIEQNAVKNVVVVGAGLNGLECSYALYERGFSVSLVDCSDRVLSAQVDQDTGRYISSLMKNKVGFYGNCFVEELIQESDRVVGVRCKNGQILPADLVICATGARVQNSLVKDSPLELHESSVVVDSTLKTSLPNVFAAGDVVFTNELVSGCKNKSMTWSDAMLQGLCAATQLSEKPRPYRGLIGMRDSEFFDRKFFACGETVNVDSYEVIEHQGEDFFHRLYLEDCCVKGFVIVGNIDQMPHYRQLFLTQKKYEKKG